MSQQKHSITPNQGRCFQNGLIQKPQRKRGETFDYRTLIKYKKKKTKQKTSPAAHKRPINKCKEVKTKAKHNTGTTLAGQDAQKT